MERGPQGPKDDREVDWESVLSMGEKQRLAMARMYFHKPKFAILDECTSGVSASMERRLYESCVKEGITCITISHRPVLEQYHDVVLNVLKDGKGGWTFRMTERGRKRRQKGEIVLDESQLTNMTMSTSNPSMSASTKPTKSTKSPDIIGTGYGEVGGVSAAYLADLGGTSAEQGQLERKHLENRSLKYRQAAAAAEGASSTQVLIDELKGGGGAEHNIAKIPIWTRFWDVWNRGFMPNGMSMSDPEARRIFFLGAMVVGKTVVADWIAFYDGYILTTGKRRTLIVWSNRFVVGSLLQNLTGVVIYFL
jgi:energy-coupling factor transporter ATP-binding protein EcfA2